MAPVAQKKAIVKASPQTRMTRAQIKALQNNNVIKNGFENASEKKPALEMGKPQQKKKIAETRVDEKPTKVVRTLRKRRKNENPEGPTASESENGDENKVSKARKKKTLKSEENCEPKETENEVPKENVRTRKGKKTTRNDNQIEAHKSKRILETSKESSKTSTVSEANRNDSEVRVLTVVPEKNNLSCVNNNNNNNYSNNNYMHISEAEDCKIKGQLLEALCAALDEPAEPEMASKTGYTYDDLGQFLMNSSIKEMFPHALESKISSAICVRFITDILHLEALRLDQLLDLYHLAIMMQTYKKSQTSHMNRRQELLEAVAELSVELHPKSIEYLGNGICDRFVIGTGMERKDKVVEMHNSIMLLINNSDVNCQIAMTTLLATFAKVSGLNLPENETDVIRKSFEMAKLVDWLQLVESGREADLFVLVRSFSLIINTKQNRAKHSNWDQELGSEIHAFFMKVLRKVRFSKNYNSFAMMVERYIAFCVVRGATARVQNKDEI